MAGEQGGGRSSGGDNLLGNRRGGVGGVLKLGVKGEGSVQGKGSKAARGC